MTFYLTTSAGWGNISLSLSDYVYKTDKPRVHRKLLDVVKCIDFQGLEFTDNDDEQAYEKRIAINSFTYNTIQSNLQKKYGRNDKIKISNGTEIKIIKFKKAENLLNQGWSIVE